MVDLDQEVDSLGPAGAGAGGVAEVVLRLADKSGTVVQVMLTVANTDSGTFYGSKSYRIK